MGGKEVYRRRIGRLTKFDPTALPNDPRIDDVMNRYLRRLRAALPKNKRKSGRVPGAAVMVKKNDKLIHLGCYGYANLETGQKITPDSVFDLGSVSKQFTAYAALAVFDSSELDTPISKFFRGFPRYADHVTIKHLIHHTSALPDYIALHVAARRAREDWYDKVMGKPDHWYPQMPSRKKAVELTNRDVLELVASQRLLPRAPDIDFEYSNTGYVLLAEIVRLVTKRRLSDVLKELVFYPVGMDSTYVFDERSRFQESDPEVLHHAKCYNAVKDKGYVPVGYSPLNFIYGDGNIHSTIVDMAKWDAHLTQLDYITVCDSLAKGEQSASEARSVLWSPAKLRQRKQAEYGAGWNLIRNKYKDQVKENGRTVTKTFASRAEHHRGLWLGWQNNIARAQKWVAPPEGEYVDPTTWENMGIVILTNNTVPGPHAEFYACALARQISRLCWGAFKKDNIMNRVDCAL